MRTRFCEYPNAVSNAHQGEHQGAPRDSSKDDLNKSRSPRLFSLSNFTGRGRANFVYFSLLKRSKYANALG